MYTGRFQHVYGNKNEVFGSLFIGMEIIVDSDCLLSVLWQKLIKHGSYVNEIFYN
jgi:hypothetical protein